MRPKTPVHYKKTAATANPRVPFQWCAQLHAQAEGGPALLSPLDRRSLLSAGVNGIGTSLY